MAIRKDGVQSSEKLLKSAIEVFSERGYKKTTVAEIFAGKGAFVIDADKVCHSLMEPSKKVYKKIVECFGPSILREDRRINRETLGEIVFANRTKLDLLNSLVHPQAIKEIERIIHRNKGKKVIVVDAALLIESGLYKKMDRIILVNANFKKQIKRIIKSRRMRRGDAVKRIRMQAGFKKKPALADFIIDNSGSKMETSLQVEGIWRTISEGKACKNL